MSIILGPLPFRTAGITGPPIVLHYKLNDNADNSIIVNDGPLGGNGTYLGAGTGSDDYTSTHSVTGKINNAINFTWDIAANRDLIQSDNQSGYLPNPLSFSLWFKVPASPTVHVLCAWGAYYITTVEYNGGTNRIGHYRTTSPGNYGLFNAGSNIMDSNWHHLAFNNPYTTWIYGHSSWQCWIDGVSKTLTSSADTDLPDAFNYFWVGDSPLPGGKTYPTKGDIDDVRIYNGNFTQAHVDEIYNGGTGTETTTLWTEV